MLKVSSPQPPMDMTPPPPMGDPMMQGDPNGGMPQMDDPNGEMQPMGEPMSQDGSDFDTNFDAGVDADENTDPKKYIQQLTGKLSQSLRKYNESLPKPETDLCKYVAGMILKQTTDGLTDGEKKEIIDKVNGGNSESGNGMDDEEIPQTNNQPMEGGEQPMMESVNHKEIVNELFQELTRKRDNTNYSIAQRPIKNISFRKKPFTAPKMR